MEKKERKVELLLGTRRARPCPRRASELEMHPGMEVRVRKAFRSVKVLVCVSCRVLPLSHSSHMSCLKFISLEK